MKKYNKPEIELFEVESVKLFACSDVNPEENTIHLGYDETDKFWENLSAD